MSETSSPQDKSPTVPGSPTVQGSPAVEAAPYAPTATAAAPRGGLASGVLFNFVVPLAILLVAVLAFFLFGKIAAEERPALDDSRSGRLQRLPTADVQVVRPLADIGGQLDLVVDGVVVPYREVQLATEVEGKVVYKDPICEAGNYVEKGQLLCRIDDEDYQLDVERLSRMREQEYEALRELDQESANAKRLLEVATEDLELREKEVRRMEALPPGFASENELDAARRARLQALQTKVGSQNQLELLVKRRSRLEASERLASVQLKAAELNLARTEIRSQVSGVIVAENAEMNSFVNRGSPIVTIEDTSKVEVAVNLRMDQLLWVLDQGESQAIAPQAGEAERPAPEQGAERGYELPETAATIRYQLAGREDAAYEWEGTLLRYDGIGLDQRTRTVPVRIIVDNPKRFQKPDGSEAISAGPTALLRGMFVSVVLHIEPQAPLVLIPSLAMQPGSRVWQFTEDESVLEATPATNGEGDGSTSQSDESTQLVADKTVTNDMGRDEAGRDEAGVDTETGGDLEDDQPVFNAEDWVAGKVLVIDTVRAIESAEIDDVEYWICEIGDGLLQAGDFVVTSPLTAVSTDIPLGVRVPLTQTTSDQAPRHQAPAEKDTAAAVTALRVKP